MPGQRVLGRIRCSRTTEDSTSAASQRESIQQWADRNQHVVVGWAEDLDLSGSINPFKTPNLGPWLQEKQDEWDILVAWRIDRIGRAALNRVFVWTEEHDKTVVGVSDNIDTSTPAGRMLALLSAGLAENELEASQHRARANRKQILESGRWPGGVVPIGLRSVPNEGGGCRLEIDPDKATIVRHLVSEITAGAAVDAVAYRLNEEGIPGPKGGPWSSTTLWKLCTSTHLLGHACYNGKSVLDAEGRPVLNAEPILTFDRWDALQKALEVRRNGGSRTRTTSPLAGVAVCYECNQAIYHRVYWRNDRKKSYRYYHCANNACKKQSKKQIRAELVEEVVEEHVLQQIGDLPIVERVFIPAGNFVVELDEAERAVEELTALVGTVTTATAKEALLAQLSKSRSRIAELEWLKVRDAQWEYRETGQTFAEAWNTADTEGRRQILLRSGITVAAAWQGENLVQEFRIPEDIEQRLSAQA